MVEASRSLRTRGLRPFDRGTFRAPVADPGADDRRVLLLIRRVPSTRWALRSQSRGGTSLLRSSSRQAEDRPDHPAVRRASRSRGVGPWRPPWRRRSCGAGLSTSIPTDPFVAFALVLRGPALSDPATPTRQVDRIEQADRCPTADRHDRKRALPAELRPGTSPRAIPSRWGTSSLRSSTPTSRAKSW